MALTTIEAGELSPAELLDNLGIEDPDTIVQAGQEFGERSRILGLQIQNLLSVVDNNDSKKARETKQRAMTGVAALRFAGYFRHLNGGLDADADVDPESLAVAIAMTGSTTRLRDRRIEKAVVATSIAVEKLEDVRFEVLGRMAGPIFRSPSSTDLAVQYIGMINRQEDGSHLPIAQILRADTEVSSSKLSVLGNVLESQENKASFVDVVDLEGQEELASDGQWVRFLISNLGISPEELTEAIRRGLGEGTVPESLVRSMEKLRGTHEVEMWKEIREALHEVPLHRRYAVPKFMDLARVLHPTSTSTRVKRRGISNHEDAVVELIEDAVDRPRFEFGGALKRVGPSEYTVEINEDRIRQDDTIPPEVVAAIQPFSKNAGKRGVKALERMWGQIVEDPTGPGTRYIINEAATLRVDGKSHRLRRYSPVERAGSGFGRNRGVSTFRFTYIVDGDHIILDSLMTHDEFDRRFR